MTKAPIRPPKSAKAGLATGLSMATTMQPAANIQDRRHMDLNFKIAPEMHAEFKAIAAMRHQKMKDLFEEMFDYWKEHNLPK